MSRSFGIFRTPLLWGGLAYIGFYTLLDQGLITSQLVLRYFASHPVEHLTTALFFVGVSALVIKAVGLAGQLTSLDRITLGPVPAGGETVAHADRLIAGLQQLPKRIHDTYLVRRLRDALELVRRNASADALERYVRHLAEDDAVRMHSSYSLVRIVVWAIPILGFLGTVIGITLAIANLSPEALESSLPEVTAGLGVAFDTTALALALSIVLMFGKFFVERMETNLLGEVDARANAELIGRFRREGPRADPNVAVVRQMGEEVVRATESLVQRQVDLWRSNIDAANRHWSQVSLGAGKQLEAALGGAVERGLRQHAQTLVAAEKSLAEENRQHWRRVQEGFAKSTAAIAAQQAELVRQGEVLKQVVQATGQVRQLEIALNDNLSALAGAGNFEETVTSLSAAIQLLSARLNHPADGPRVRLPSKPSAAPAA